MKTILKTAFIVFSLIILSCSKDDGPAPQPPVEEQNAPPVINVQNFEAAENIAANIIIGTVEASDEDDDTLVFSISANDNNIFEITETGELSLATGQNLDFETAESHTITIEVTDGNATAMAEITIAVTDITENTAPVIEAQTFTVLENIADNMPIGTVEASDPDNDTLTFGISANDNNLFEISNAGVLSLDDLQSLDFETAQSHSISIAVNDGTATTEATININVTNVDDTSFVSTWQTTTANETVTIPTRNLFTYDYTIDWGDGTTQTGRTGDATHTFTNAGTHTVRISGTFPAIYLDNNPISQNQLRTVEQWGTIVWRTMERAFARTNNLTISATDTPNLSQVTNMNFMFLSVTEFSVNSSINNWDVSNVTTMRNAFQLSSFNQDISGWEVSNVVIMSGMFSRTSSFNQNISEWEVGNVTDMSFMFQSSPFNQDISDWNVGNVTNCTKFALNAPLTPANTPNFTNCTPQ